MAGRHQSLTQAGSSLGQGPAWPTGGRSLQPAGPLPNLPEPLRTEVWFPDITLESFLLNKRTIQGQKLTPRRARISLRVSSWQPGPQAQPA